MTQLCMFVLMMDGIALGVCTRFRTVFFLVSRLSTALSLFLSVNMLNLVNLRTLLSKVLDPPTLHTVALFTPEGELICCETGPYKTKDHVRVIVGLSTEVWQETKEENAGMVDSEVRLCSGW